MGWAEFGWPLLAATVVAFGVAVSTSRTWAGVVGAILAAPLCFYLTDMPYLQWVSLVALGANFLAVAAMWRGRHDIAFALLLPFMITTAIVVILWYRNFSVFRGFEF